MEAQSVARSYYAVVRSSWKMVGDVICFHDKTFRSYLDSVLNLHAVKWDSVRHK